MPVRVQDAERVAVAEVLELHQRLGERRGGRLHELLDHRVVLGRGEATVRQAQVQGIGEQGVVLRPDIQRDRQARRRRDARAGGVERELADGDAHPVGAQVAQAEDALAVGDHDDAHGRLPPVAHDRGDPSPVGGRDEQPPGPAPDVAQALAGQADRRRVDDRHHLVDVVHDHPVEEPLVPVLERDEVDVLLEVGRLAAEVLQDLGDLLVLREDLRRQQPLQLQPLAFVRGEGRPLVERRVVQQPAARGLAVRGWLAHR